MKTTVLFDLDGTLLPMDLDKFMKLYFYNLGVHFQDLIDPKDLMKYILNLEYEISNDKKYSLNFEVLISKLELINMNLDYENNDGNNENNVNSKGQIQYTSTNIPSWSSTTIKFRAHTTSK